MPGSGNFFFVRSTKLKPSEVISLDGNPLWSASVATFARIDAICGEGASRLFAEPNVKNQNGGGIVNVAWFGSYDDDPKEMATVDRAKLVRVEEDLAQKLAALRPALADTNFGPTVAAMLNLYDHASIMAVGEHAILTNWGALPANATDSLAGYSQHSGATIGRFLRADMSPGLPGKTWTAPGDIEMEPQPQRRAIQGSPKSSPTILSGDTVRPDLKSPPRWWIPAALVVLFGTILAYTAWPGNLVYEKESPIEAGVLSQLDATHETVTREITTLRTEISKGACEIDPTLVGLPPRHATGGQSPAGAGTGAVK